MDHWLLTPAFVKKDLEVIVVSRLIIAQVIPAFMGGVCQRRVDISADVLTDEQEIAANLMLVSVDRTRAKGGDVSMRLDHIGVSAHQVTVDGTANMAQVHVILPLVATALSAIPIEMVTTLANVDQASLGDIAK